MLSPDATLHTRHAPSIERAFSTLREDLARRGWAPAPLPGSRQEAEAIRRLPPPGILHLATHGFFLDDAPGPTASRAVGQGVYGLRRAFLVAGAESVVVSLWKVNDETTRALMEAYYSNLLAGQGRATALSEAMRAFRRAHPHPHYWAPFIAMGRDTPLHLLVPSPQLGPSRGDHLSLPPAARAMKCSR